MYYVAIIPKYNAYIEGIRSEFDPLSDAVPAHVTLVFPTHWDNPSAAINHVNRIATHTPPFTVTTRDFTGQDDDLIFLNIKKGNDDIINLHDRLYTGPFENLYNNQLTYLPHITVARIKNPFTWQETLESLSAEPSEFSFAVDRLSIYKVSAGKDILIHESTLKEMPIHNHTVILNKIGSPA
ncbi:hypothetical protein CS022_17845 [Veronia nyctiphanis]|uniref:2'-5' RNA ligase n=1 Tax=Veronia nyctiphanis TaxID=1278244 RepID=A0A4Q0YMN7_9GAMM|nr:2'-5' RNA ligase family protein [Veronia nyctiphanis]RXJ72130.1 hypothetical protein CS022_17845 [Veronia nyctiphanis]